MNFKHLEKLRVDHRIQFFTATAFFIYWPWYFIFNSISPDLHDDLPGRLSISFLSGLIFLYSKMNSHSRRRLQFYFDFGIVLILVHYTCLLTNNNWDYNYRNAYLAAVIILATTANQLSEYLWFSGVSLFLPILFLPISPSISIPSFLLFELTNAAVLLFVGATVRTNSLYRKELKASAEDKTKTTKLLALGQLASGMAHEINNPLAVIKGRSDQILMRTVSDAPVDKEWLRTELAKIGNSVEKIAKIARGLRTFARNSEKDGFTQIEISHWIQTAVSMCQDRLKNGNITVKVTEIPQASVLGRESQLVQVLLNLINNSIDALATSATKNIDIAFEKTDEKIKIFVSDSGPGIPSDLQHKLNEPFYSTKMITQGFGLGLSISRGIMENHNGSLTYLAVPQSTCFCIEIPLAGQEIKKEAA